MKIKKYKQGGIVKLQGGRTVKAIAKVIKSTSEIKDSGKELVSQIIKDNSIERLLNTILSEQSPSEQNRFWKIVKAYTPKSIGNGFSMHEINSDLPNGFVADALGNIRVVPGTPAQQNYIYDALYNNRIDDRIIPMVRAAAKGEIENGWKAKNKSGIMFGGGGIDQSLVIPYFLGDGSRANKVSNLKYNITGKFNPTTKTTEIGHKYGIKGIQSAIESHEPEKAAELLVDMLKSPVKSDSYLSELIKNAEAISLKNPGYYDTSKQSAAFEWIRSRNTPSIIDSNGNAVVLHYLPEGKVIKFPDMPQWTVTARRSNLSENPEFFKLKSELEQIAGKPINSDAISTDKVVNLLDTEIPGNNIFWSRVGDFHGIKQPSIVSESTSRANPILIGVKPWDSPIVKVPLTFNHGGIIKAQGGAGKKAIKAISKIAENIKGTNKITDLDKIKNRVKITLSDPEKYWYVGHQTGSGNFDNIAKYGLQTTNGLSGTAISLSQDFTNTFAKGLTKKLHLSHEGSDGLVIMKFPKVKFPSSDLDDISIRLMDLGESKNFEVPPEYLSFIKKQQLENGGILKQEL